MTELNIYSNRANPTEPMLNVSVEWVTQITENREGKENRIPKITEAQYTIEGSDFALRDDDYDVFVNAFLVAEGKNNAFPFKCPLDYYCTTNGETYDTGCFQRGLLVAIDELNYQIVKQYSVGGVSTYKTILLPVDGTIHIYEDDIEVFPTVNLSTGVVTFTNPPTGTLKVECEFRLPMRFDVDDNQLNQIKRAVNSIYSANDTSIYLAVNFRLLEDMNYERKSPLNNSNWQNNLGYTFDGNPLADVAYSERSLTRIQSSDNKRELRDGLGIFRKKYAIANNNMNWNNAQKYYTLFMACKGRLLPFTFEGSLVRLDSDVFTATTIGYSNVAINETALPIGNTYIINLRYKNNSSDPFTNLNLTFTAIAVNSILLGELNNLSNSIGVSGFPSINWLTQTAGGETLYVQVEIIDSENITRYLDASDLIPPTYIEYSSNPVSNWIIVSGAQGGDGDLKLFEYVSLVQG